MIVMPMSGLLLFVPRAGLCLRDAVQSQNGSTADAHVLALAWMAGGDLWRADRDFRSTGVASWSTPISCTCWQKRMLHGIVSQAHRNEMHGINRVVNNITSKPPVTIEWE